MHKVRLFDASDFGAGVVVTEATREELQAEARWAVRGGWTKFVGDQDVFEHYIAADTPEELRPRVPWSPQPE
eukprot:8922534-Lingulodinium_polyedra.AAC.1